MTGKAKAQALKALAIAHRELQGANAYIGAEHAELRADIQQSMERVYGLMQRVENLPSRHAMPPP